MSCGRYSASLGVAINMEEAMCNMYKHQSLLFLPLLFSCFNSLDQLTSKSHEYHQRRKREDEEGTGGQLQSQMAAASVNVRSGSQQTSIYSLSQRGGEVV